MSGVWLKALSCFTLTDFPKISADKLAEALMAQQFVPCGDLDREQHGFTPVFEQESLVRQTQDIFWLQVKSEKKVVPGSAVKRKLKERVLEIEKNEGRKVGKKEQKNLKEMVVDELLAKALTVQSDVIVMIDSAAGYLLVNTTSTRTADLVMTLLLKCIDGLGFARMEFARPISGAMSELLLDADTSNFVTDSSLVLKGPGTPAATVRFAQHGLAAPEIVTHMNAGLRPVALELGWKERVSFILTDPFTIKKLTFLELVQTELESAKPEDPEELTDAILLIQAGELREVIGGLTEWLGKPEKNAAPPQKEAA